MTAKSDIPDIETHESDSGVRYAFRILLEIESQQAQIAAQGSRASAESRSPNAVRRERRAAPPAAEKASQAELARRDLEKEFHKREQALRRRLELQKWHAKYASMLMEVSPEFRLGALLKKAAGEGTSLDAAELLARLGDQNSTEAREAGAEIARILSEGEILRNLLPLLDPLPVI